MLVNITTDEKEVLRNAYLHLRVRFIVFDSESKTVKCYSEKSEFIFEAGIGNLYEIAKKLPPHKTFSLVELINES